MENNQKALTEQFIKEYEEIEQLIKEQISNDDIISWDDESLLMMKHLLKMVDTYKTLLLQQAERNDYLVKTITEINSKLDVLLKDRA